MDETKGITTRELIKRSAKTGSTRLEGFFVFFQIMKSKLANYRRLT